MNNICNIHIIDDHPAVCHGLSAILSEEASFNIVAQSHSFAEAWSHFQNSDADADVVLVDIQLPDGSGFELARKIKKEKPLTRVIVISAQNEQTVLGWVLKSGADGFITKTQDPLSIRQSVHKAWQGKMAISSEAHQWLARSVHRADGRLQRLTVREFEVFFALGLGSSTKATAHQLGLSPRTIETHYRNIREKMAVPCQNSLTRLATLIFCAHPMRYQRVRDDLKLMQRFETSEIPQSEWTHTAHLRLGFLYLVRRPFSAGLRSLIQGIRALNLTHNKPNAYHATITEAYARMLRAYIQDLAPWLDSMDFIHDHPELAQKSPMTPLLKYYSRTLLLSDRARLEFVPPDLAPLPEVREHL